MTDAQTEAFLNSLQQINTSLAQLVKIQLERLALEKQTMTPQIVQQLIAFIQSLIAVINADNTEIATQAAAVTAAQTALTNLQATDAALQDPSLLASAQAAIASATAALPPTPPATPPAIALFSATTTYTAGQTVTDATGNVWTAVTPVLGEAPGVTAGNWTLTTPAPVVATPAPVGSP
jgi:hypothetical protein